VIDDILIDKRKGCIDFEHGPPTESVVGARLTCAGCVFSQCVASAVCFTRLISMLFKGTLAYLVLTSLAGDCGSTVINTRDGNHAEGVDATNPIVFSLPLLPPSLLYFGYH